MPAPVEKVNKSDMDKLKQEIEKLEEQNKGYLKKISENNKEAENKNK